MSTRTSLTTQEPAGTVGVIVALVAATLGLLAAFGVEVTEEQKSAVIAFVIALAVAGPLIAGWLIRRKVTPSANVVVQLEKSGEVVAGEASTRPTGLILEPGETIEGVAP